MCTVHADITLTRSKVKVKITVLLNSENCRKLNFSRSISSAILSWSSKLMVDYDNMGLSLQLIGARFLNFCLRNKAITWLQTLRNVDTTGQSRISVLLGNRVAWLGMLVVLHVLYMPISPWPDTMSRSRSRGFRIAEKCTFLGLYPPPFCHFGV